MRRHRRDYEVISEMNLTNLLDTAFVLLIAFIMASPTMRHGIQIDLPKVTAGTLEQKDKTVMTIVLKKNPLADSDSDCIYVDDNRMDLDQLSAMLDTKKLASPNMDVVLEADQGVLYGAVARVIGTLKNRGIENVGLPTEPADLQPEKPGGARPRPRP